MANFTRTHADAVWNNGGGGGYITLATDWASLDTKLFGAVNGDKGGCWNPTSAIVFGDVGNPASPSLTVTGPTTIATGGGGGSIATKSGSRFIFSYANVPKLAAIHLGQKRTIVTHCVRRQATPPYTWITRPASASIQSIACSVYATEGGEYLPPASLPGGGSGPALSIPVQTAIVQPSFVLPLRVHNNARLVRATLTFRVPSPRTTSPLAMPKMRVVAVDKFGNLYPLKLTDDGSGFVSMPTASSGSTWYSSGQAQSFVYECDQNQTIDTSQFYYQAQVVEEVDLVSAPTSTTFDGSLVLEKKPSVQGASTTNQAVLSGVDKVIDGVTMNVDGWRVLLKDQTDPTQNGIWVVHSGSWTRAGDADEDADYTPNFLVGVGGLGLGAAPQTGQIGQLFQLTNTDQIRVGLSAIKFARRTPRGNIYHAIACDFDSIADLRFQ